MNKHIEKYLENYIEKQKKPEFAVLLNGEWGSGKTYFMNQFIDKYASENKNIKFIKISFFEISNKNDLQHKIIMKLLGIQDEGGWFGKSTKVGASIINSFGKKLGLSIYDIPIEEILNKVDKKVIFIFDDLERTNISLHEVLGYINNYVEILKYNVIILANELKINDEKYQEFKEKVIGKTFEVQHDFEKVLSSFTTNELEQYINDNRILIQDIYNNANYNNLRHIKQTLLDFTYFINLIDEEYLENKEFMSELIEYFFIFSIEAKGSRLYERKNLFYYKDDIDCEKEEKGCKEEKDKCKQQRKKCENEEIDKFYKKHNIPNKFFILFGENIWIKIIFKTSINKEELNELISNLSTFLIEKKVTEEEVKKRPSWVDLWHYRELSNDDFIKVLNDVIDKFKNCSYEIPEHFVHVIALLISLSKEGLCDLSLTDIKMQVDKCIEKFKTATPWKDKLFEGRIKFNTTGLGYTNAEDDDFIELFKQIKEENRKVYQTEVDIKEMKKLDTFLEKIIAGDKEFMIDFLLEEYGGKPIFKNLSSKQFIDTLSDTSNGNITELGYILNARYFERDSCYLIDELLFWKALKGDFEYKTEEGLRKHLLQVFKEYRIDKIIEKLENCNKSS